MGSLRPLSRSRRAVLRRAAALVALPAFVGACARDDDADAARAGIRLVRTPHGGTVPAVQYDAAADRLHVLYLAGQDVFHVESSDAGATFSDPHPVNDKPRFASGGFFRGPELAIGSGGVVHAIWYSRAWESKVDKSEQGVRYTRRSLGGAFEPSRCLGGEPSDGYSVVVRDQQVSLAWHNGDQLKLRRSDDGGRVFAAPLVVADTLPCECCATSQQLTPHGAVLVAFRDRRDDKRDMYLTLVERSGAPARKLRLDAQSWVIKACPMSGSTVLLGAGQATAVWERAGRVLLGRVALQGWQRGEPLDLGAGKYPIALDNAGSMLVAWVDGKKLRWKRLDSLSLKPTHEGSVARKGASRAAGAVSRGGEFVLVV